MILAGSYILMFVLLTLHAISVDKNFFI